MQPEPHRCVAPTRSRQRQRPQPSLNSCTQRTGWDAQSASCSHAAAKSHSRPYTAPRKAAGTHAAAHRPHRDTHSCTRYKTHKRTGSGTTWTDSNGHTPENGWSAVQRLRWWVGRVCWWRLGCSEAHQQHARPCLHTQDGWPRQHSSKSKQKVSTQLVILSSERMETRSHVKALMLAVCIVVSTAVKLPSKGCSNAWRPLPCAVH